MITRTFVTRLAFPSLCVVLASCSAYSAEPTVEVTPEPQVALHVPVPVVQEVPVEIVEPAPVQNPLPVPFSSQAPTKDWGDPYQEACEEMSLIMIDYFLQGRSLDVDSANEEVLQFVEWQTREGYGESVSMEQLATIARKYYGYDARIENTVTIESIEELLDLGHPIIVPTAGKELQNPYFRGGGPWYHMLVIIGYDDTHFITNDPGTSAGGGYVYEKHLLVNAIHDWTGIPEQISSGPRAMLVLKPMTYVKN